MLLLMCTENIPITETFLRSNLNFYNFLITLSTYCKIDMSPKETNAYITEFSIIVIIFISNLDVRKERCKYVVPTLPHNYV